MLFVSMTMNSARQSGFGFDTFLKSEHALPAERQKQEQTEEKTFGIQRSRRQTSTAKKWGWGCMGPARRRQQVRFPGTAREFSPRVNFQCRLSHGVRAPLCAIACIDICAHVKDPVVHVRVRRIMGTLKHRACTVGWVPRLCRS